MSEFQRQGMVTASDGTSRSQPMRLQLNAETIILQKEELVYSNSSDAVSLISSADKRERQVKVNRKKIGGLGLSIKGGAEHNLPILISRIFKDQAADQAGQLYVGDAIIKVNDINIEHCNHDDAVNILKTAGNEVTLTVRHYSAATPFLTHNLPNCKVPDTEYHLESDDDWRSPRSSRHSQNLPKLEKRWTDVITVPLLMAYITRYIAGTDKLRPNSFEIKSHDNSSVAVIHCDDPTSLNTWVQQITHNIQEANNHQMKVLNQSFLPGEMILHFGWAEEAVLMPRRPWCQWHPRFIALKGPDVCLFNKPPRNLRDWMKCPVTYKVYQTMMKIVKDSECQDERSNCFLLQMFSGDTHYFSIENKSELSALEIAWQRATYTSVTKLGSKTFTAISRGKTAGLTLDWNMGFALYDTEAKCYLWKYRFSQLKGSSDDGKTRLKLHFQDPETKEIETKELETPSLQSLLFCIHAFLTAKVASVDPSFLCST